MNSVCLTIWSLFTTLYSFISVIRVAEQYTKWKHSHFQQKPIEWSVVWASTALYLTYHVRRWWHPHALLQWGATLFVIQQARSVLYGLVSPCFKCSSALEVMCWLIPCQLRATQWRLPLFSLCHLLLVSCWICAKKTQHEIGAHFRVQVIPPYTCTHKFIHTNMFTDTHKKHKLIFHCSTDQMQFPTFAYLLRITYV